jgi:DNA-binding LacI/PurR family transcriptional regulator
MRQHKAEMSGRRITIRHVAKDSGVSIATVTRVLQDSIHVMPETRERVRAAIDRLGYRPDSVARALVSGTSTNTIGLIIPTSSDLYWGEVAAGVEFQAREAGFVVLLGHANRSPEQERELAQLFVGKRIDGLILGGIASTEFEWLRRVQKEIPVVFIGRDTPTRATTAGTALNKVEPVPFAGLERALATLAGGDGPPRGGPLFLADDRLGARMVVSHLLDLGHRNIGFIAGRLLEPSLRMIGGIRDVLEPRGLWPCPIWRCDETLEAGRAAATAILQRPDRPTALFGYSDLIAIGAMRGAYELGIKVPEDVSVIGFDDIEAASFVQPALTSVRVPKFEFGTLAVKALISMKRSTRVLSETAVPPVGLVLRESTAAPVKEAMGSSDAAVTLPRSRTSRRHR